MTPTTSVANLAWYAWRSACRLDRYRSMTAPPPEFVAHERALLEGLALRLVEAARHADEPTWRWDIEARG